jgi:hypothetical protein
MLKNLMRGRKAAGKVRFSKPYTKKYYFEYELI